MKQAEFKSIGEDAQNLVTEMFGLSGVWEISTHYLSVTMTIGRTYAMEEYILKVVAIIATLFYYDWAELEDIAIEYIGSSKPPSVECHFYETVQTQFNLDHIKKMKQIS
jgi:hypothetical protein